MNRRKFLIISLRVLIFIFLIFLLLQPEKIIYEKIKVKPELPILIDVSRSMEISDPISRIREAKRLLNQKSLEQLNKNYNFSLYTFGGANFKEISFADLENIKCQEESTNISNALLQLDKKISGKPISGVILITDGADNSGENIISVVSNLNYPIYTVGVGNPEGAKDIEINQIITSDFVFRTLPAEVKVKIKGNGFSKSKIPVILKQGEEIIQTKEILFDEDEESEITFSFIPQKIGEFNYTVSVPVYEGEISGENNKRSFLLKVIREKIRVLYLCGQPGWEYSFLRHILVNDPSVELVSFVILRNPENIAVVDESQLSLIPFPAHELFNKEIFNFDLVIFENFSYTRFFPAYYLGNVKKLVEENGSGFLMLGGENSFGSGGYTQTAINQLLPVKLKPQEKIINGEFRMKIKNISHSITSLGLTEEQAKEIWQQMPSLENYNFLLEPREDSQILATATSPEGESIILSTRKAGKGRVMALATNTTWRWKFQTAAKGKTDYYSRFWQNTVRWLTGDPSLDLVSILDTVSNLQIGEQVQVPVRVLNHNYQPARDVDLKVELINPQGKKNELYPTSMIEEGKYLFNFIPLIPGEYLLKVTAYQNGLLGEAEKKFAVNVPYLEFTNFERNDYLLNQISQRSGGKYYPIEQLNNLLDIKLSKYDVSAKKKVTFWDKPYFYVIIISLILIEWYLRKKQGWN